MKKFVKRFILTGVCVFGTVSAFADIPPPPHPVGPVGQNLEILLVGKDATEFASKLEGQFIRGAMMRHGSSKYKVFRSSSGQNQIVCEVWSGAMKGQDNCTITQSSSGEALPYFRPSRPMG